MDLCIRLYFSMYYNTLLLTLRHASLCSNDVAVNAEVLKLKMHIAEVPGTRKPLAGGAHEGWVYEISKDSNQL